MLIHHLSFIPSILSPIENFLDITIFAVVEDFADFEKFLDMMLINEELETGF